MLGLKACTTTAQLKVNGFLTGLQLMLTYTVAGEPPLLLDGCSRAEQDRGEKQVFKSGERGCKDGQSIDTQARKLEVRSPEPT